MFPNNKATNKHIFAILMLVMQDLKQKIDKISSDFKKIEETLNIKEKETKLLKLEAKYGLKKIYKIYSGLS